MKNLKTISIILGIILLTIIIGCIDNEQQMTSTYTPIPTSVSDINREVISTPRPTEKIVSTATPIPIPTMNIDQIKSQAISVSYDDLLRDNEQYVGKIIKYRVILGQVNDLSNGRYNIIAIPLKPNAEEDSLDSAETLKPLYLMYQGKRMLNNDIIDIWGVVKGIMNYESIEGGQLSAPEINVFHVEIVKKAT